MRAMTRCASSLLMVMIWGCGASGLTLEQMKAPVLDVVLPPLEPPTQWSNQLAIRLREAGEECPDLSSKTKVFFNDKQIDMSGVGHWEEPSDFLWHTSGFCTDTSFHAKEDELPKNIRDDVTRIRMTEGAATFHAEALGVCVPRSVAMSFPTDGVLRPGDEVTLVWEPVTDELLVDRIRLKTSSQSATQPLAQLDDGTLRVEGNLLHFQMPQLRPFPAGRAEILLFGRDEEYRPPVTRCEGFTECHFKCGLVVESWSIPVTLKAG
jgi:hypothetical protein